MLDGDIQVYGAEHSFVILFAMTRTVLFVAIAIRAC